MDASRNANAPGMVAALLNGQLASAIDLHAQVKQAHWNVRGPGFIGLHELFDTISADVEDWSDLIAERAGALGACAEGGITAAARATALPAYDLGIASGAAHIDRLAMALRLFADDARAAIDRAAELGDAVTADVLTEITRAADAARWKVAAHRPVAETVA